MVTVRVSAGRYALELELELELGLWLRVRVRVRVRVTTFFEHRSGDRTN